MKKIKIAISGKANSGKDTLSKMLIEELGIAEDCYKVAFADAIKEIIIDTFPEADKECLWGPSEKRSEYIPGAQKARFNSSNCLEKTDLEYREAVLDAGKLGRYYDADLWAWASVLAATKSGKNLVISDLRFKNELRILKSEGFVLIRLIRTNNKYSVDDISEKDLDDVPDSDFDFVLVNDAGVTEFCGKIKKLAEEIKINYSG